MAYTTYGYRWWSDECHNGTGNCDGYVPEEDTDAAGAECACGCHREYHDFETMDEVREWHEDQRRQGF